MNHAEWQFFFGDLPRVPKSTVHRTKSEERGWGRGAKIPRHIWRNGAQYYSIPELAARRGVTYDVASNFALQRPHLTVSWGSHIYCLDVPAPPVFPRNLYQDGLEYLSIPALRERRKITTWAAIKWARAHPHLTVGIRGRLYVRDEEWRPKTLPDSLRIDGLLYFSAPALARRRNVLISSVYTWMKRHPHLSISDGAHLYTRDEEWRPKSLPPFIWRDGQVYYSAPELASRRGTTKTATRTWILAHPHLTLRDGQFFYARDEEWTSKVPWVMAPPPNAPPPPIPPAVRYQAARRASRAARR